MYFYTRCICINVFAFLHQSHHDFSIKYVTPNLKNAHTSPTAQYTLVIINGKNSSVESPTTVLVVTGVDSAGHVIVVEFIVSGVHVSSPPTATDDDREAM